MKFHLLLAISALSALFLASAAHAQGNPATVTVDTFSDPLISGDIIQVTLIEADGEWPPGLVHLICYDNSYPPGHANHKSGFAIVFPPTWGFATTVDVEIPDYDRLRVETTLTSQEFEYPVT